MGAKELILVVYLWAQGKDYEQISNEGNISYRHVCNVGTQLPECLQDYLQNSCDTHQLGGVDVVCEIDETEYGTKVKNQIGRKTDIKMDCSGAIQRDNGKIILQPFDKPGKQPDPCRFGPAGKEEVLPLVEKYVENGSIVCSDRLRAYRDTLEKMGYKWAGVDHNNAECIGHQPHLHLHERKKTAACILEHDRWLVVPPKEVFRVRIGASHNIHTQCLQQRSSGGTMRRIQTCPWT